MTVWRSSSSVTWPPTEADRRRAARPLAFAAIVVLVAIAVVAVLAFQGLDLLRTSSGTDAEIGKGEADGSVPLVMPQPTPIMPSLFAPPDSWLAGAG